MDYRSMVVFVTLLSSFKMKYGTIHLHNLQWLMTQIFKTKNNPNTIYTESIFTKREVKYNLRRKIIKNHLQLPSVKTAKYGFKNT